MKIMFKGIATLIGGLALAAFLAGPAHAVYSLVWSDEFDGTSLNTADWNYDIGDGCPDLCGWGNAELEYYRAENVTVSGGHLALTAKEEWYGGRQFTSGKIHTRNKHSFLYGRIEVRAKIPTGGGMWPAIWMMPQDDAYGGWAASGEIDIMESANATNYINGTIHYGGSWPDNQHTGGTYTQGGLNFADDFHVYAIEWEQDQIRWYVDGVLYSTKHYWDWWSSGAPGNDYAPFDQPFFVILNLAVGGNYTGCWDAGCVTDALPQDFLIDYVRVYEDNGGGGEQSPFHGNPIALPALIEAEDFDQGGEGVAYHDLDAANHGGGYRPAEGVDIGTCEDTGGGWSIGWMGSSEWLEYTVDVPVAGDYPIELRMAAEGAVGSFRIEQDGVDVTGNVNVPVTGGWQTWTTVATEAHLEAGESVLRFVVTGNGYNLNSIDILEPTPAGDLPPSRTALHAAYPNPFNPKTTIRYDLTAAGRVHLTVFDIAGRVVKRLVDGEFVETGHHSVDWNGLDEAGLDAAAGVYLYRLEAEGRFETRRMTLLK